MFELKAEDLPLSEVLKKLSMQTGIAVADHRRTQTNQRVTFNFNGVPFWQALDQIAGATNMGLSLYQADGGVALVDGPYRRLPVSYSGLFRMALKRVTLPIGTGARGKQAKLVLVDDSTTGHLDVDDVWIWR